MKRLIKQRMHANKSLPEIFDSEIVTRHPNKMALTDMETGVTYSFVEMQKETLKVANYFQVYCCFTFFNINLLLFQSIGLKKGDVVALFMINASEFPIIWFGLARLGVITAWINFNQRQTALAHSINIAKAKAIVCSGELQSGVCLFDYFIQTILF
jgi:solute carrier family 27 fatty acid transporter 1/4